MTLQEKIDMKEKAANIQRRIDRLEVLNEVYESLQKKIKYNESLMDEGCDITQYIDGLNDALDAVKKIKA